MANGILRTTDVRFIQKITQLRGGLGRGADGHRREPTEQLRPGGSGKCHRELFGRTSDIWHTNPDNRDTYTKQITLTGYRTGTLYVEQGRPLTKLLSNAGHGND